MSKIAPLPPPAAEMKRLQVAIEKGNTSEALTVLKNSETTADLAHYKCSNETIESDDTILHLAAAFLDERHNAIIKKIVTLSPELLAAVKTNGHQGQTPLHILIVRKQNDTLREIKILLSPTKPPGELKLSDVVRNRIFDPTVRGKLFNKTIMEGELPFMVAALTLDIETVTVVLEMTGTNIKAQNSKGNTVYHHLVEHAARHPEDIQEVTAMWNFLSSYADDNGKAMQAALGSKHALRLTNKDNLRPLQLAAKHGVPKLFNIILNSEKILNVKDRLFDSYLFDISVIDTVAHFKVQKCNGRS